HRDGEQNVERTGTARGVRWTCGTDGATGERKQRKTSGLKLNPEHRRGQRRALYRKSSKWSTQPTNRVDSLGSGGATARSAAETLPPTRRPAGRAQSRPGRCRYPATTAATAGWRPSPA